MSKLSATDVDAAMHEIVELENQLWPIVFNKPHYVIGPTLAELAAWWISGFDPDERERIFNDFVTLMLSLRLRYDREERRFVN